MKYMTSRTQMKAIAARLVIVLALLSLRSHMPAVPCNWSFCPDQGLSCSFGCWPLEMFDATDCRTNASGCCYCEFRVLRCNCDSDPEYEEEWHKVLRRVQYLGWTCTGAGTYQGHCIGTEPPPG